MEYPAFFKFENVEDRLAYYVRIRDATTLEVININQGIGDHGQGYTLQRKGGLSDTDWQFFVEKHSTGSYQPCTSVLWNKAIERLQQLTQILN